MPDPRPDGFHFNKDGTITAVLDGDAFKLKRPKTGEYKRLIFASRARDDELGELRAKANEESSPPEGKTVDQLNEAESAALIEIARERNREITDRQGELDRGWFRLVFNGEGERPGLSDKPLPDDDDDWPVWLWQSDNVRQLLEHWRTAPLVLGKS